jgi:hypothetical protein
MGIKIFMTRLDAATHDICTLIAELGSIAKNAPSDVIARKELYHAAQSLTNVLESPTDAIQRLAYLACLHTNHGKNQGGASYHGLHRCRFESFKIIAERKEGRAEGGGGLEVCS